MQQIYVQELEYGKHLDWKQFKNQKKIYLTVFSKNRAQITYLLQDSVQTLSVTLDKENIRPGKFISVKNPFLKEENHNVTEALLGDANAFDFFKEVQPNYFIIDFCFKMLYKYAVGGVYERTLELIFGILYRNYHRAKEGFPLYPLSLENLNALGKFLDKS